MDEGLKLFIAVIVLAFALMILWLFLKRVTGESLDFADEVISLFKSMLPAPLRWVLPGI